MPSLFYDGNKRRIYEVPDASSFVVDGDGYRIYTPDDIPGAPTRTLNTRAEIWSRWVDYHNANKWTTLAFDLSGGTYRFDDSNDNPVYLTIDLRLTNDWLFVAADYKHKWVVQANILPNLSTGEDFDVDRMTAQGVVAQIQFSESLQTVEVGGRGGLTDEEAAHLSDVHNAHFARRIRDINTGIERLFTVDNPNEAYKFFVTTTLDGEVVEVLPVAEAEVSTNLFSREFSLDFG